MKRSGALWLSALAICVFVVAGFRPQGGRIDRKQLREILVQLGHEVKDLSTDPGKEKYSFVVTEGGLDIPVGAEISSSDSYIWLTVNLGDSPSEASPKSLALLKKNMETQPAHFYVTKSGRLMMGLPIENREVSNALLRDRAASIVKHVVETKDAWQG